MEECIFCKIARKDIPVNVLYEDDDVLVFPDQKPVKPVHLLIIPKQHVQELMKVEDSELFGKLFSVVQKAAKKTGLDKKGFRVVINAGGAQEIQHLHIHLLGPMGIKAKME